MVLTLTPVATVPSHADSPAPIRYADSVLDLVGNTPLVRLNRVTRDLGPLDRQPLILAKLEMLNPGGSVKDRIGIRMIEAAERAGLLRPGGTIIEPTSGNTGHGLAIAAALKGYRCVFVLADKQSSEKQGLLRAYGADVVVCPTDVPPESPESYYSVAARLARDISGAWMPGQYWNQENPAAHEATTGPEIWEQTGGRITHFVAGAGTGGTITGTGRYLRSRKPDVVIVGGDTEGSVFTGDTPRPYLTEGVGEDFFPDTLDRSIVDRWVRVPDVEAFAAARRLTREEGILAGESSGTALVAALSVARELADSGQGGDAVMVVLLPDTGRNYLSKLYNDDWMREHGLLKLPAGTARVGELLKDRHHGAPLPPLVVAHTADTVGHTISRLQEHGISQMPVADGPAVDGPVATEALVGSVSDTGLLDRVFRDPRVIERTIGEVMNRPLPLVDARSTVDTAVELLSKGAPALVVLSDGVPTGIATRLDLLEYLNHHGVPGADRV
jgi:cystathionine beta-synthase